MNPVASDLPTSFTLLPEIISTQAPAPFVFPTELKKYSPIYKALYSAEVNKEEVVKPILMVFSSKEAQISEEDGDELKAQKQKAAQEQADKQRNDYFKTIKEYVGDDKQKIIFIQNYKSHWTVYEGSKNDVELKKHEISDNGYCGVVAAIVASKLINGEDPNTPENPEEDCLQKKDNGSFELKTMPDSLEFGVDEHLELLSYCFGFQPYTVNDNSAQDIVVKLIENLGKSQGQNGENLWLEDSHIMEIINHRNREAFANINLLTDGEAIESISKTQSFERKIAFLKYLNSESVDFSNSINGVGGIATEELLSEKGIGPKNFELCIDVLEKFTAQLNQVSDTDTLNLINKKPSSRAFYLLMKEVIEDENFNFTEDNIIVREREFSGFQNSFDEYFKKVTPFLTKEEEGKKEEYELQKNAINKKLTEKLLPIIQTKKKVYSEFISGDNDFFNNILGFNLQNNKKADSFKNRIDKLKNYLKDSADEIALLAKHDEDFLEAILPERNQLKPKVPFKGWGLKIRFEEGGKIFIDDKEVKSIVDDTNGGSNDITAQLRKDFPDNPKLFQLGVIDFFRNADSVQLIYDDPNTPQQLLNHDNKKTLICDDSEVGFATSSMSYDETEIDKIQFFNQRLNEYRGIEEEMQAPSQIPSSTSTVRNGDKGVDAVQLAQSPPKSVGAVMGGVAGE